MIPGLTTFGWRKQQVTMTRYARYAAGQSLTPPLYPIVYALDVIQQHQLEMKSLL